MAGTAYNKTHARRQSIIRKLVYGCNWEREDHVTLRSVERYRARDNELWVYTKGEKLLDRARNHEDTASITNHVFFIFTVPLLLAFSRRMMVIDINKLSDSSMINKLTISRKQEKQEVAAESDTSILATRSVRNHRTSRLYTGTHSEYELQKMAIFGVNV